MKFFQRRYKIEEFINSISSKQIAKNIDEQILNDLLYGHFNILKSETGSYNLNIITENSQRVIKI